MSEETGSECPVCYEKVSRHSAALRTLTCRHIFCHDCLVKTVVNQGTKPKRVVCPVCRHVTFLSKRGLVAMATDKAPPQTLRIPLPTPEPPPPPPTTVPVPPPPGGAFGSLCRSLRGCCPGTPRAAAQRSRVFVISGRGRPMSEEERRAPADRGGGAGGGGAGGGSRRGRLRWILLLLGFVIVGAVIAAVLPWAMTNPGHK
ncbi:RING finger protein 222 [Callorhinchus milii]|uniref:RING finger protein 222 n=1 Tax=Callorhinchus milii TaxID=7868 RepID=UPI001C3FD6DE|nr:RING finger protein 222 [Callorhinchus milii]